MLLYTIDGPWGEFIYDIELYVWSWALREMSLRKLQQSQLSWRAERANSKGIYHDRVKGQDSSLEVQDETYG